MFACLPFHDHQNCGPAKTFQNCAFSVFIQDICYYYVSFMLVVWTLRVQVCVHVYPGTDLIFRGTGH